MSVIFPPAILGPEMAAPILWAPGIFWLFLVEIPHAHKIPRSRRGCWGFLEGGGGGGSANFIYMGAGNFLKFSNRSCILKSQSAKLQVLVLRSEENCQIKSVKNRCDFLGGAESFRSVSAFSKSQRFRDAKLPPTGC